MEEGEGEGGGERKKKGKKGGGCQVTDERCSYIPDERIKMQISRRRERHTFAGVHRGVDILGGLHKLPECTTIFRCYKLTAKIKLIYSKKVLINNATALISQLFAS